ncbi:MAG: YbfB/YjiJ family MFS transporter [Hyphomicrobiaceae bacterium]
MSTSPFSRRPRIVTWRRIAIGCGSAMFLCMALGRFSFGAMVPSLVANGQMSVVEAGYIGGANLVGFLIGALASVALTRRVSLGHLMNGAILLALAALIGSAFDLGVFWLGTWRCLIGIVTGIVMVQSLAIATVHAPDDKRPQAASYVFIGVGLGILLTGSAVPIALEHGLPAAWWTIALVGIIAALLARWGLHELPQATRVTREPFSLPWNGTWLALIAASFCFSFGIVPHTLYWFDFLARTQQLGYVVAGAHWIVIGLFGILGPMFAAKLAAGVGTAAATTITFLILAVGIAIPVVSHTSFSLIVSSIIFGMQPGVSTMLAARVRDLGTAAQTPEMMRATIIANGVGAAAGGVAIPTLLDATSTPALLFAFGAAAFLVGGLLCIIFQRT